MPTPLVILSRFPGYEPYDLEREMVTGRGADFHVAPEGPETVPDALMGRCEALLNVGWQVPAAVMDRMPRLRSITNYGIGTDSIDVAAATERGIVVSNLPLATVDDVANHAVALILACVRRIVSLDAAVRRGQYDPGLLKPSHSPRGKTLGLVAFGNIARAVADKMSAGFGMQAIAFDPHVAPEVAERHGVRLTSLEEVMRESDLISVHAPRTPETHGMIGEAELRLMKSRAYLVVTSRGGIVDEPALIRALREGWIAGAGLDVQAREPMPPDDPLLDAPNLILTPHCAGYSEESAVEVKRLAADAACRVLAGQWPRWVVNRSVRPKVPLAGEPPV